MQVLDSLQIGNDLAGFTCAAVACVLVCIPVAFGIGVITLSGANKAKDSFVDAGNDVTLLTSSPAQKTCLQKVGKDFKSRSIERSQEERSQEYGDGLEAVDFGHLVGATHELSDNREQSLHAHSWPLCPGLVVREAGGAMFTMTGNASVWARGSVVEFKRAVTNDIAARAFMSHGAEGLPYGIILESSLRLPIAVLESEEEWTRHAAIDVDKRSVRVFRASQCLANGSLDGLPFCTMYPDVTNRCSFGMVLGASDGASLALSVRVRDDGTVANILDCEGKLIAATEAPSEESDRRSITLLHIVGGVDSCLVMIALLATQRLVQSF